MRALITGGMGHVGGLLAAALSARGDTAVRLDRSVSGGAGIAMDVTDVAALAGLLRHERFDAIFHLAGLDASAPRAEMERVNVEGTRAVLEAARGSDARVVVMSSSAVYGACKDDPITEDSRLAPVMPYGASKLAAEGVARAAARQSWVAVARPFNIVGPGQRAAMLQNAVLKQIVRAEREAVPPILKLGWLGNARDFIDGRDVAVGLRAIIEKGESGEAYNLCSGEATKARALVEMLLQMSNKSFEIQDAKEKPTTADVDYQCGSAEKLRQASGWTPRIPLRRSLRDSLEWRRQHD